MLTKDKIIEIFCIADDFSKGFDIEVKHTELPVMTAKSTGSAPVQCPTVK